LATKGYAPALFDVKDLPGGWKMVVMAKLPGDAKAAFDLPKGEHNQEIAEVLGHLHSLGFVHGDFRCNNVFISPPNKIWVIDFDWSGPEGITRYPLGMNHAEIVWPEGASDGLLLRKDHDLHFLSTF